MRRKILDDTQNAQAVLESMQRVGEDDGVEFVKEVFKEYCKWFESPRKLLIGIGTPKSMEVRRWLIEAFPKQHIEIMSTLIGIGTDESLNMRDELKQWA